MQNLESKPWLNRYAPGVPATVEIPALTVTSIFDRAVRTWPERVAVDFFGQPTTYAELARQADRAAGALRILGVTPGDRVALVLPNCASHVVAFHAVLRLGAIVVEHNPTYSADELAHQLADSGATVALTWTKAVPAVVAAKDRTSLRHIVAVDMARDLPTSKRLALRLPIPKARELRTAMCSPVPAGIPLWHELVAKANPVPSSVPAPTPTDVALLQYTGGTTGTPQAAILTHRNLVSNATQGQAWVTFGEGSETVYGALPFFHAFGMMFCLVLSPYVGATLVAFPKFDAAALLAAQRRRPATFLPGVAPMFDRLVNAQQAQRRPTDLSSLRLAFAGAMPVSADTARRWEEATGGLLIEGYGMTEASPVILGNPATSDRRQGTLGLPFPSTDIRVVNQDDPHADPEIVETEAGPLVRGELLVRGPQVSQGYWNHPEETARQLVDGEWLRTGDIVVVDDDGMVTLVDRIKEMIITGGFKVYPSQVEDHLRTMPGVRDIAVVGMPGRGTDEQVAAVVVLDEDLEAADAGRTLVQRVDLESLREWGNQRLARYALPKSITFVSDLPRSQIGKVLRRVVRDNLLAAREGASGRGIAGPA